MKHLGNYPKDLEHATYNIYIPPGSNIQQVWQEHLRFREGKIIGPPKANDRYTSEQLAEQGLIGLYEGDDGPQKED